MKLHISIAIVALILLALAALLLFGPREPTGFSLSFHPASIGSDPEAYLAAREAQVPGIRPGAAKEIVWAYPASRAKTPFSIVYVHGFSASKEEMRPLPDLVAQELRANLFFIRLTGHGRDGAAMDEASVERWMKDLAEAVAIGEAIGERVILMGASTGATLATLGAAQPELAERLAGLVLLSPNYGLRDRRARLLDLPFARQFLPLIAEEEYGFEPLNAEHAKHWTTRYPTTALLPMAALIRATRSADIEDIPVPAFFIYSPNDRVVNPQKIAEVIDRWSAPREVMQVEASGDPGNHILAGRILSPATTIENAARIVAWIGSLSPQAGVRPAAAEDRGRG